MNEAKRMLEAGRAMMMDDYGESFTVDGISGIFNGLFEGLTTGNQVTTSAFDPEGGGTLIVDRGEGWKPKVGQLVFVNHLGLEYKVESIGQEPGHYRLTLGPNK